MRRPSSDDQNIENAPTAPILFVWVSSRTGRRINRRIPCSSRGIGAAWLLLRKGTEEMKTEDIMAVIENRDQASQGGDVTLGQCPHCHGAVSELVDKCPYCGRPLTTQRKKYLGKYLAYLFWLGILAFLVLLIILVPLCGSTRSGA